MTQSTFTRLEREPAYLKVCKAIEAKIGDGTLPAGAPLPTEAELCIQFGVTRSTVREGLRLLEQSHLVERGPGKKFIVKHPDSADVAETTSRSLVHSGATFREVWETLAVLYPGAARLAAISLSAEDLAKLRAVRAELAAAEESDHKATVTFAVRFFQVIATGLDNRVMLAMLQSLNLMIGASLRRVIADTPNAKRRILNAQENIIACFEAHDEDEAATWMAKHIGDLKRGYLVARVDLNQKIV